MQTGYIPVIAIHLRNTFFFFLLISRKVFLGLITITESPHWPYHLVLKMILLIFTLLRTPGMEIHEINESCFPSELQSHKILNSVFE